MLVAKTHKRPLLLIQPSMMHPVAFSHVLSHMLLDIMFILLKPLSQVLGAREDLKAIMSWSWVNIQEKVGPRLHLQPLLLQDLPGRLLSRGDALWRETSLCACTHTYTLSFWKKKIIKLELPHTFLMLFTTQGYPDEKAHGGWNSVFALLTTPLPKGRSFFLKFSWRHCHHADPCNQAVASAYGGYNFLIGTKVL